MGGLTAQAGQYIGTFVGPEIGKFTSTLTKSPVVQQALTQGTTNAISGFAIGTGLSLVSGSSIKEALGSGGKGALMGFGIGTVNGIVSGVQYAHKQNVDPWSGEGLKNSSVRTDPQNLAEQLTMQESQSGQGNPIMQGKINDQNWQGWQKMQHSHLDLNTNKNITIHYWYNPETRTMSGFKFKN